MSNDTSAFNTSSGVSVVDLIIIIIYFVVCLGVGIWATLRTQRTSVSGYFLAGRDMLWFAVGASIFASDIGSGAIVGFAGTGAYSGIAVSSYELNVYTLPEYLKKRFGGQRLQVYMSVLSLILYVFTKISADIYAAAIFIQQTIGWNMYLGICVILVVTAIYTILGGLKAVIYTDTLQTVIIIVGSFILMIISFVKIGGIENLYDQYPKAIPYPRVNNSDCGLPPDDAFHILRHPTKSDLPWPGNIFGITILGLWYFCSDQVLVQRSLAAKNMHHVKGGSILAGYLKLTPLFTMVFPGMISRVLYTDQVACVDPDVCNVVCGNPAGCTNIAYPKLVIELMPIGLKGLMLASMMAALMSSLTSVFNSSSTIFTMDIWSKIRSRASDAELLLVGKLFVLVLVAISVIWIPVLKESQGGQLMNYIQSVTGYLAPPVLSVFVLAMSWKRTNEQGAFWGLIFGFAVGVIRMGLDFGYGSPGCGEIDNRPDVVAKVHFLYFTIILFAVSVTVTILVSLCTAPMDEKQLVRLTWWTRFDRDATDPVEHELRELPDTITSRTDHVTADHVTDEHVTTDHVSSDHVTTMGEDENEGGSSKLKRYLHVISGMDSLKRPRDISESDQRNLTSIEEHPKWRTFVNVNAVILMLIATFLIGYFR
ncbi:Sodium/glucose cotransporter 4 [Mactra antiquata]